MTEPQKISRLSGRLNVRHAGSLTPMCAAIHQEFKRRNPDVEICDVGGGAVLMARELAGGKDCDVYASVDYSNIPNLLIPDFADWYVIFASTGFVLRYTDKSKYASEINSENWVNIIQRDDVTFWRSNPEDDPAGYRTLLVLQLAEKYYGIPGLCQKIAAKSGKQFLSVAFLEPRDTGYCFSYSSHLMGGKSIILPDEINLSNGAWAKNYRQASVTIPSLKPEATLTMRGERIRIGMTIPRTCKNRGAAIAWTRLLLSRTGTSLIKQAGKTPVKHIFRGDLAKLPLALVGYTIRRKKNKRGVK